MKTALERFLQYVRIDTASSETTGNHPSTPGQRVFAEKLFHELQSIGLQNVRMSQDAYVFAELPATPGCENAPVLGWIAHMDTSCAASGKNVQPQIVRYDGKVLPLGKSGKVLDPAVFPSLKNHVGKKIVVTDGTTLLGADDKAGLAEIVTAAETILNRKLPHGKLCFGFTPDEEIGEGTLGFDVKDFGADFAYTLDGGEVSAIEYQNFNAARADLVFTGVSVHPGSAKNTMRNALKLAMAFDAELPKNETPERTENFEGFYHLTDLAGNVSCANAQYILRDHDTAKFDAKKEMMKAITARLNRKYGKGSVSLKLFDQYRNMAKIIDQHIFLIDLAKEALRELGIMPQIVPIRGGTDGAMLSFKGLPCPNLGTGGYNYHGEYEYLVADEMEQSVQLILAIVKKFSKR